MGFSRQEYWSGMPLPYSTPKEMFCETKEEPHLLTTLTLLNSLGKQAEHSREKSYRVYVAILKWMARVLYPLLSTSLSLFLYRHFSLSASLSLAELSFLRSFTSDCPFLWFHPPAFLSFTLPLVPTQAYGKDLIQRKGPKKSLWASKCLWKYFWNVHTVTDISYIACGWIHS